MRRLNLFCGLGVIVLLAACRKKETPAPQNSTPSSFSLNVLKINGLSNGAYTNVNLKPVIKISFTAPVNTLSVNGSVTLKSKAGAGAAFSAAYENGDSTIVIQPTGLSALTQYTLNVSTGLKSSKTDR